MMARIETVVLKIGGSVITEKESNRFEVRRDEVRRIAGEIAAARERHALRLVLVHGAGPFGHTMVSDYSIAGGLGVPRGIEGFVRTHNSMEDLNYAVMCELRAEGLLGFPIQPSACIRQRDRKIVSFETAFVRGLLELDAEIVPVLYGDMVLDDALQASVVSGDAIVAHLAPALGAARVLMGTDVDGVFAGDPKIDPRARRIERISAESFAAVMQSVQGATTVDVTGGMARKLQEIRACLGGIRVTIFDAMGARNVERALLGETLGTQIEV